MLLLLLEVDGAIGLVCVKWCLRQILVEPVKTLFSAIHHAVAKLAETTASKTLALAHNFKLPLLFELLVHRQERREHKVGHLNGLQLKRGRLVNKLFLKILELSFVVLSFLKSNAE